MLRVLKGAASREVVRRRALAAALHDAQYRGGAAALARIRDRPPPAAVAEELFRLRRNRFDALRLRVPAAKARFAAATARWTAGEFRRALRALALVFNGPLARGFPGAGASALEPGVFFGFEDAALTGARAPKVEARFEDDGDDGGHANRCALVFATPGDLAAFYDLVEADRALGVVAVSNGFARKDAASSSAPHEVALALDLMGQGVLCDVRLRLRALERPQRHLGSLAFLADATSHEEVLLPIWPDVAAYDGFAPGLAAPDRAASSKLSKVDLKGKRDYTHPPRWGQTS